MNLNEIMATLEGMKDMGIDNLTLFDALYFMLSNTDQSTDPQIKQLFDICTMIIDMEE